MNEILAAEYSAEDFERERQRAKVGFYVSFPPTKIGATYKIVSGHGFSPYGTNTNLNNDTIRLAKMLTQAAEQARELEMLKVPTIDLDSCDLKSILDVYNEGKTYPPEYTRNFVISDLIADLKELKNAERLACLVDNEDLRRRVSQGCYSVDLNTLDKIIEVLEGTNDWKLHE